MNKKIFYSVALAAAALSMTGCADGELASDSSKYSFTDSLAQLDYLKDYDGLKTYVDRTVNPNFKLGVGVGASDYVNQSVPYRLANANFDEMTAGNAFKYASCVKSDGSMDFSLVKKIVAAASNAGMSIFGHTLAWHSQQQNAYLKGLVAGGTKNYVLHVNTPEAKANLWDWSVTVNLKKKLEVDKEYTLVLKAMGSSEYTITCWPLYPNDKGADAAQYWPTPSVAMTTEWKTIQSSFTAKNPITKLQFVFGPFAGDIWFDDVQLLDADGNNYIDNGSFDDGLSDWSKPGWLLHTVERAEDPAPAEDPDAPSPKEALTTAMQTWIDGMMEACDGKVVAWDVVNEALSGADTDGDGIYDLQHAATASAEDKKNCFYWQDYLGDLDYVRTAVKAARESFAAHNGNAADLKLFINDYNLEATWDNNKKLESLIEWIKRWEADQVTKIDGIASQMHVSYNADPAKQEKQKECIVNMYKLMAKSGKLCKVSELDMGYVDAAGNVVETKNLNDTQQKEMADFYQFIIEEYFKNIPANKRYGITQWCITDAPDNSGWRKSQPVGLWTQSYDRKRAYGGFAEGLKTGSPLQ